MIGKYKLFNWQTLKKEKYQEKNLLVHRFMIPKGFHETPGRIYAEKVYSSIKEYINIYNEVNKPSYFIFIVDDDKITKLDMGILYDIICTGFTKALTEVNLREDREYRLGVSEVEKSIDMGFINMKKWLNNKNKCEIVGMEVIGWQKHWKRRMVR